MPIERVEVTNFDNWGKLIKTWATGDNYFAPQTYDGGTPKIPTDLAEFKKQCAWANVDIKVPTRIKGVEFVVSNLETLLIRIPPGPMVKDGEEVVAKTKTYPMPPFYMFFGMGEPTLNEDNRLEFHASRIGDYTIAQCI